MIWNDEKIHSFLPSVAKKYGVNAAIILNNIKFWIDHNQENGTNQFEDNTWTYNSIDAFQRQFPYMSVKQIRTALNKLKDEGIIITGNFNTNSFNHTTWYALTDKGKSIYQIIRRFDYEESQKGTIDSAKRANQDLPSRENRFAPEGKSSITDINITDINTDVTDFPKMENHTRTTDPKHKYGEYKHVLLTDKEYERLINDYGEDDTRAAIKFLDEYIEEKHYKSNSHNLALRRWVFDAVKERKEKAKPKTAPGQYDWDNL